MTKRRSYLRDVAKIDFKHYLQCKPFLLAKDALIATTCADIIRPIGVTGPLRVLDVGSGEASLLERICVDLSKGENPIGLEVDAIEPSREGGRSLRFVAERLRESGVPIHIHEATIQQYLALPRRVTYDVILCIHSMYFIRKSEWKSLVPELTLRLRRGGVAIFDLVSARSSIYCDLWPKLEAEVRSRHVPRLYEAFGHFVFSRDFREIVDKVDYTAAELRGSIEFGSGMLDEARYLRSVGKLEHSQFATFLAFMYRCEPRRFGNVLSSLWNTLFPIEPVQLSLESIDEIFLCRGEK